MWGRVATRMGAHVAKRSRKRRISCRVLTTSRALLGRKGPGGSFVGLGAMLLALMGIPVTALLNFLFIQDSRRHPQRAFAQKVLLTSCVLPVLQLALLILVKVYRL